MELKQRGGREASCATHTPFGLTQNALVSALPEGLLHILQSPVLMLPPPLGSHGAWDIPNPAPITLSLLGSGVVSPQDWGFLKGGAMSGLCSREGCEEVRGILLQPTSPKKGEMELPHSYAESSN